jgi:hypothetical protein
VRDLLRKARRIVVKIGPGIAAPSGFAGAGPLPEAGGTNDEPNLDSRSRNDYVWPMSAGKVRGETAVLPTSVRLPRGLLARATRYARLRHLKLAAALRTLVSERLDELEQDAQLSRAEQWQRTQAWAAAQSVADGSAKEVTWAELRADYEAATRRRRNARVVR